MSPARQPASAVINYLTLTGGKYWLAGPGLSLPWHTVLAPSIATLLSFLLARADPCAAARRRPPNWLARPANGGGQGATAAPPGIGWLRIGLEGKPNGRTPQPASLFNAPRGGGQYRMCELTAHSGYLGSALPPGQRLASRPASERCLPASLPASLLCWALPCRPALVPAQRRCL